jgi:hypothetical protein
VLFDYNKRENATTLPLVEPYYMTLLRVVSTKLATTSDSSRNYAYARNA